MSQALRESSLNFSDVAISSLVVQESNPNQMSEPEFERLKKEISEVGFLVPIVVAANRDGETFTIINGHHRVKAASEVGYQFIPSVILYDDKFKDPDFLELLNLRINNIHGQIDPIKLLPIYRKNVDKFGVEKIQEVMGFANNLYWKKTKKQMEKYLSAANLSDSQKAEIMADVDLGKSPGSIQKKLKKALSGANGSDMMNTVLFTAQGKEHLAVPLPHDLFKILKALAMKCQEEQMDLANILREPIVDSYRLIAGDQGLG